MNNKKRKELTNAVSLLNNAESIIESVRDDEQDCLDNMPENLEGSQQYSDMENAVDYLEEAMNSIMEAQDFVERIL